MSYILTEPADGGNLNTDLSAHDGTDFVIVPRTHVSEAVSGSRWNVFLFQIEGVLNEATSFRFSTESAHFNMNSGTRAKSNTNCFPVWSYDNETWHEFDNYIKNVAASGSIRFWNDAPFSQDSIYVSLNEREGVLSFYDRVLNEYIAHPWVSMLPGHASYEIGTQAGASAGSAFSRDIPPMPLYGFMFADPSLNPDRVAIIESGQHPFEHQNKWAFDGFIRFVMSDDPVAYLYRSKFITLFYPHSNPTGEYAGIWRGQAANPFLDTNRNWDTTGVIDTVDIHKASWNAAISALGMGAPTVALDFHQAFSRANGYIPNDGGYIGTKFWETLTDYLPAVENEPTTHVVERLRGYWTKHLGAYLSAAPERLMWGSQETEEYSGEAYARTLVDLAVADEFGTVNTYTGPSMLREQPIGPSIFYPQGYLDGLEPEANAPPVFQTSPPTTVRAGEAYVYHGVVTDSDGDPITITLEEGPDWLELTDHGDGTFTLEGTAPEVGA